MAAERQALTPEQQSPSSSPPLSNAAYDLVADYVSASRSDNTRRAYESDLRNFRRWGGSIPSSADEIARFLAEHAATLKCASLKRYLAALATAHHDLGAPDPTKE